MGVEILNLEAVKCYACIQWDGMRDYDHQLKKVKVDVSREGNCRVWHLKKKGSQTCDKFTKLK